MSIPLTNWFGTNENDFYTGSSENEFIDGAGGDDILAGGLGDDFISGGPGLNAALFNGNRDDYLMTVTEDGQNRVLVGPDGHDTLSGIGSLIFDDITIPLVNYGRFIDPFYNVEAPPNRILPISSHISLTNGGSASLRVELNSAGIPGYNWKTAEVRVYDDEGNQLGETIPVFAHESSAATGIVSAASLLTWQGDFWALDVKLSGSTRQEVYDSSGTLIEVNAVGTPPPVSYATHVIGNPVQGQELSVDVSRLREVMPDADLSYQWQKDRVAIDGKTGETLLLNQSEIDARISVTVSLVDQTGIERTFTTLLTSPVQNTNDAPEGQISLEGAPVAGKVLTATANIDDQDGLGALYYQWLLDGVEITGADSESYTPRISDIGSEISVRISYTDGFGTQESVVSSTGHVSLTIPDIQVLGSSENDELIGSDLSELIAGLAGNDTLMGGRGKDLLQGGAGDDLLSGEGTLAASFGLTIANQVYRMYQSALDRTPDATGHAAWSERIASGQFTLLEVADSFVRSPEFVQTYENLSNGEFVELLYNNVLDRASDAIGLTRWTQDLEDGATRAELLRGFSQSPEFIDSTNAAASNFAMNNSGSDWTDTVYRLYSATLDREPDIVGLQNWSERLGNGERSLLEVTDGFIQSQEFRSVYNDLLDAEFVTLLYRNVLDRQPDSFGLERWTAELENGSSRAEIVLGFSESPQFKTNSASSLEDWMRGEGADDILDAGAGENTLYGGMLSDTFMFDVANGGSHIVMDLETWDTLYFRGFGYTNDGDIREHMAQLDGDVIFSDQNLNATFVGVELIGISDEMLL